MISDPIPLPVVLAEVNRLETLLGHNVVTNITREWLESEVNGPTESDATK